MKVELERRDLVNLVKGTTPNYDVMKDPIVGKCGYYTGGFHDKWTWYMSFSDEITQEEL